MNLSITTNAPSHKSRIPILVLSPVLTLPGVGSAVLFSVPVPVPEAVAFITLDAIDGIDKCVTPMTTLRSADESGGELNMNILEAIAPATPLPELAVVSTVEAGATDIVVTPPPGICTTNPLGPRLTTSWLPRVMSEPPKVTVCPSMAIADSPDTAEMVYPSTVPTTPALVGAGAGKSLLAMVAMVVPALDGIG